VRWFRSAVEDGSRPIQVDDAQNRSVGSLLVPLGGPPVAADVHASWHLDMRVGVGARGVTVGVVVEQRGAEPQCVGGRAVLLLERAGAYDLAEQARREAKGMG
jgi:hypothetical protein